MEFDCTCDECHYPRIIGWTDENGDHQEVDVASYDEADAVIDDLRAKNIPYSVNLA